MNNNKIMKGVLVFILYLLVPMILGQFLPSLNESTLATLAIRFLCDVAMIVTFILIYKEDFKKYNTDFKNNKKKIILNGIFFAFLAFVTMPLCNIFLHLLNVGTSDANNDMIVSLYGIMPLYIIFQTLIYTTIVEGIVFRKVFKDVINNKIIFILVSSLVCGIYHVIYNLTSAIEILQMIPYFMISICFCISYTKTDNIYTSFIATFIYNLAILIIQAL